MGSFPYSQLKFALSKGVIYEKTHEVLSAVEDRLLEQYPWKSRRSIRHASAFRSIPGRHSELLDYAHFANKYAAHGERHKADLTYATYSLQRGVPEIEIRDTIRAHTSTSAFVNRSQRDQDAYIDRTVKKALKQNGFSHAYSALLTFRKNSAANRFPPIRGEGRLASLPRFDPSGFSATHPSGVKPRNAPAHLQKKCARTSDSIPHGEKKRNRRAALA